MLHCVTLHDVTMCYTDVTMCYTDITTLMLLLALVCYAALHTISSGNKNFPECPGAECPHPSLSVRGPGGTLCGSDGIHLPNTHLTLHRPLRSGVSG